MKIFMTIGAFNYMYFKTGCLKWEEGFLILFR